MARGYKATRKQSAAGRRNLLKANVNRVGKRGRKYRKHP